MIILGIEKFGLDNWTDISKYIGTKNKFQCESHYYSFYIEIHSNLQNLTNDEIKKREDCMTEHLTNNPGILPIESSQNKDINNSQTRSLIRSRNEVNTNDSIGYSAKRDEFENEYMNNAELDIADLEFSEDESDNETALKYNVLKVYNAQLIEREKHKKFFRQKNLIDFDFFLNVERKMNKDDREIYNCLKPFAKVIDSKEEFNSFFEGVVLEKNLRERINQLQQYKYFLYYFRCNGINSYSQIEKALESEYKREKKKFNPNLIIQNNGLVGKMVKFLNEHNEEYSKDEIHYKEKELCSRINKTAYKEIKKASLCFKLNSKNSKNDK